MRKYCFVFWLFLVINPLFAQIYKWTDSNGVVHFSDKPNPGAEKIDLPNASTYSSPPPSVAPPKPETAVSPPAQAPVNSSTNSNVEAQAYKSVEIIQPQDQLTIRNPQGYVKVITQLDPELKTGDVVQVIFDGQPVGEPKSATVFDLRDIDRGSHRLAVQVLSPEGEVLKKSGEITIYLQQPRVGMVPETRKNNRPAP